MKDKLMILGFEVLFERSLIDREVETLHIPTIMGTIDFDRKYVDDDDNWIWEANNVKIDNENM